MFNKVHLAVGSLFLVLVVSCASDNVAGGTIDPNSLALYSSSSADVEDVLSSSANTSSPNVMSSSSSSGTKKGVDASSSSQSQDVKLSSDAVDGPILSSRNFSIQCVDDVIHVDLEAPSVAADVGSPVAYKHVEGDSVNLTLLSVYFDIPCDEEKQKIFMDEVNSASPILGLDVDSLYIDFARSKGMEYGCSCVVNASLTLDKVYSDFNYAVFDQKRVLLVQKP